MFIKSLKSFELLEPKTIEEAVTILASYDGKAAVLAGGTGLMLAMKGGYMKPEVVVSIQKIPGLDYIEGDGQSGLRIGALTTHRAVELSPAVLRDYPVLYEAIHSLASVQVKNMATVVGSLCLGTPLSNAAVALLALGAEVKVASLTSVRTIPLDSFFIGENRTVLEPGELVTEISVPSLSARTGGAFLRLARTATDRAKVMVAVTVTAKDGTCEDCKIALGAVAPTPMRAKNAEKLLKGQKLDGERIVEVAEAAAEETKPITDLRSTAEYRKEMVKVLVRRAIGSVLEKAKL